MALPELVRLRPGAAKGGFSLDPGRIREIFRYARPLGHHHVPDTLNLGFDSVLADGVFKTVGGTAQWSDPDKVRRHFARFGVEDWVSHHHMRSDEFFGAGGETPIDLAFIDGSHAFKDVQHDFLAVLRRARKNT
jgi:hypothetical protein